MTKSIHSAPFARLVGAWLAVLCFLGVIDPIYAQCFYDSGDFGAITVTASGSGCGTFLTFGGITGVWLGDTNNTESCTLALSPAFPGASISVELTAHSCVDLHCEKVRFRLNGIDYDVQPEDVDNSSPPGGFPVVLLPSGEIEGAQGGNGDGRATVSFNSATDLVDTIEIHHIITEGAPNGTVYRVCVGHQMCFYVDRGLPGHAFVQFLPGSGSQAGRRDLVSGKYPGSWNLFTGNGEIKNDRHRPWDQRICYSVTPAQYNAAADKVNQKITGPTPYRLVKDPPGNCVNWMTDAAQAAELVLPDKTALFGIATPGAFGRSLEDIGDGGEFQGGLVNFNSDPNIGPDGEPVAVVLPFDWDAEETALAAHADPAGLADELNLTLNQLDLGDFSTDADILVQVNNVLPDEMLITVDWGDGSALDGQATSFLHSYGAPGTYLASLAIVNSGDVNFYLWRSVVNSPAFDQGALIVVDVPTPTPAGGSNPGFEDPVHIEDVVESAIFSDGFESGDTSRWSTTVP